MSRKVCLDKKITKPAHKALSISILMCCVNAQLGEHEEQLFLDRFCRKFVGGIQPGQPKYRLEMIT